MHNPIPDPSKLDYQVGFSYFAEWWRVDQSIKEDKERNKNGGRPRVKSEKESREERAKEREQIQAAYDAYKEKLQVQMARTFVQQHKLDEWFKERYVPESRDEFRKRLCQMKKEAYDRFVQDLDAGRFDEFTLEGIYKSEHNGSGGIVEKEEGETTAANEVLGVGDLLPTRGGDMRDEAANQPTLLIKTIAPTVSRAKMEEFCKEHLGEDEGGFRWLSLSDPNPQKKYHRIGWVMLNPSSADPMHVDERGDGRDEDGEEAEEGAIKSEHETSPNSVAASKAMAELNGQTIKDEERGDFTCHVGIHEPPGVVRKKALWDLFSAPERVERDLNLAIRLVNRLDAELGEEHNGQAKVDQQVEDLRAKGWLQPPVSAVPEKKINEEDMEEEEGALEEGEDEGEFDDEVDDEELLAKKKRLDLLVEYLRRVHNFCLFCVFESDSVHELTRKCPGGHLRRPRASLSTSAKTAAKASAAGQQFPFKKQDSKEDSGDANGSPGDEKKPKLSVKTQQQLQRAFNWVRTYEDKLMQILEPDSVDLKKLGGKPIEEGLEDELNKHVNQEDENKWRCKVPECTKLFKGQHFWRKHVEKRHTAFFEKLKQEVCLTFKWIITYEV
jgi:serrate RNA effector molecule